jgi:outer membrane protein OmpA-like peptidoglycan-associated protein
LFSLFYDYQKNPFVELNAAGDRSRSIVEGMHSFQILGALQLSKTTTFFANLPIHKVDLNPAINGDKGGFALGELRAFFKFRITDPESKIQVSAIPEFHIPLTEKGQRYFVSGGGPGVGFRFGADTTLGKWRLGSHLGVVFSPRSVYKNVNYNYLAPLGFGVSRQLTERVSLLGEINSAFTFTGNNFQNILQAYVGPKVLFSKGVVGFAQLGTGRFTSGSSVDWRVVAGVKLPTFFSSDSLVSETGETMAMNTEPGLFDVPQKPLIQIKETIIRQTDYRRFVSFKHDRTFLDWSAKVQLIDLSERILEKYRSDTSLKVEVLGYASKRGRPSRNIALSEQRALNAKRYLVSLGVPAQIITTKAVGTVSRQNLKAKTKLQQELLDRRIEVLVTSGNHKTEEGEKLL